MRWWTRRRTGCSTASTRPSRANAAFQYRAALGLLPLVRAGDAVRAELLLDSARCELRAGAVEDAWRSCRAAADLGRATGDAAVVADAATVLRGITSSPLTAQIHAMSREALALLRGCRTAATAVTTGGAGPAETPATAPLVDRVPARRPIPVRGSRPRPVHARCQGTAR